MAIGRSEDRGTTRGIQWCSDITEVFGARSAQPIWASGHDDRTTKAGHMTAIDQSNRVADTLRAGGRPHMDPALRRERCVREDALSARCKSVPEPVVGSVIESNCVAVRRGGEQLEVNW